MLGGCAGAAPNYTFLIAMEDPGAWPAILSSAGILPAGGRPSNLFVLGSVPSGSAEAWVHKIEQGAIVVLQGSSDLAAALGIRPTDKNVTVRSVIDDHAAQLAVVWEKPVELPVNILPADAHIFVRALGERSFAGGLASRKRSDCSGWPPPRASWVTNAFHT